MPKIKIPHKIRYSNLKLQRIRAGMTQKQLSEASGVPVKSLGNLEQKRRNINHCRVDIVYRLASALGCEMIDILDSEELIKSSKLPLIP